MKKYLLFFCFFSSLTSQAQVHIQLWSKTYDKKIDLQHQPITDSISFQNANFLYGIVLNSSTFLSDANIDEGLVRKEADFTTTKFKREANFSSTEFMTATHFYSSHFFNRTFFLGTHFFKSTKFVGTQFMKGADFELAEFSKNADFTNAEFRGHINFDYAVFNPGTLNLSNDVLNDSTNLSFNNTILPDTILFANNSNVKADIFFSNANFTTSVILSDKDHKQYSFKPKLPILIYLFHSNVTKLHLDYFHFKLLLPDSTIMSPEASLVALSRPDQEKKFISNDEKESIYEALLNNFKNNGQTDSYQLLDIEYKKFQWDNGFWTKHLVCLPRYWWNFSYDKEYVFGWTFVFVFIFTLITYVDIYNLNTNVYTIKTIPTNSMWKKRLSFEGGWSRLKYSFVYTAIVFFKFSLNIENFKFSRKRSACYVIFVYTMGVVCIAYMANFVLQKV